MLVGQVAETTPALICLCCTKDELAEMEPFIEGHYIKAEEPVPPHGEKRGTRTKQVELFVRVFDDTEKAGQALKDLESANLRGDIGIRSAAVLVNDRDGRMSVTESGDVDADHGALFGAITV